MTRSHSAIMKRRAAVAAVLSIVTFMASVTALTLIERIDVDSQPRTRAAALVEPFLPRLAETQDAGERQKLLESLVRSSGGIAAAVVVKPDLTIQAAYPGPSELVGRSVRDEDAEAKPDQAEPDTTPPDGGAAGEPGSPTATVVTPESSEEVRMRRDAARDRSKGIRAGAKMRKQAIRESWAGIRGHEEDYIPGRLQEMMSEAPSIGSEALGVGPIQDRLINPSGDLSGWLLALPRNDRRGREILSSLAPLFGMGAGFSFLLYSFMLPWWVYLDARPRTNKAVPLALFVFLTNFLGWLTYLVIRPESDRLCPGCESPLDPGYRLCPMCGWSGASRCHQCGRPARPDWRFCPYCEAARPDVELSAGLPPVPEPGKPWA